MLASAQTYEIMTPQDVGFEETEIVLTKHSGKHAIRHRLEKLGIDCKSQDLDEVFTVFKALADKKKIVTNEELISMMKGEFV
jgi:2-isopropylmalate synthase